MCRFIVLRLFAKHVWDCGKIEPFVWKMNSMATRCVRKRAAWRCCLTLSEATMLRESTTMSFLLLSLLSLAVTGSDVINVQLDESELDGTADRWSWSIVSLKGETFNRTTCQAFLLWLGSGQVRKGEKILGARLKHLTVNFFLFF